MHTLPPNSMDIRIYAAKPIRFPALKWGTLSFCTALHNAFSSYTAEFAPGEVMLYYNVWMAYS